MNEKQRDEQGVDKLARAMKAKLTRKRREGKGRWWDATVCSSYDLAQMLVDHIEKGDPVDVANFAMMLHARSDPIGWQ